MTANQTNTAPGPEELTSVQEQTLLALLSQPSVASVARAVDVGESTIWRWLKEPAFKSRYREMRKEAVSAVIYRLQALLGDAAETLHSLAIDECTPPAVRVSAAKALLDSGLRAVSIDEMGEQLEDLEASFEALAANAARERR